MAVTGHVRAKAPMSGALKLLIGLGAVAMIVGVIVVATSMRNADRDSPTDAAQPTWTPGAPEQVACAAIREEYADGTLFDRTTEHANDIHARVITPLMDSPGANSNFVRQQLIVALADLQAYIGNSSNRLTPAQILAALDIQCSSHGVPIA